MTHSSGCSRVIGVTLGGHMTQLESLYIVVCFGNIVLDPNVLDSLNPLWDE